MRRRETTRAEATRFRWVSNCAAFKNIKNHWAGEELSSTFRSGPFEYSNPGTAAPPPHPPPPPTPGFPPHPLHARKVYAQKTARPDCTWPRPSAARTRECRLCLGMMITGMIMMITGMARAMLRPRRCRRRRRPPPPPRACSRCTSTRSCSGVACRAGGLRARPGLAGTRRGTTRCCRSVSAASTRGSRCALQRKHRLRGWAVAEVDRRRRRRPRQRRLVLPGHRLR
jgi:hypothetical protein